MHLQQPGLMYSASGPSKKNRERINKCKGTGDLRYIYENEFDKACSQHDMVSGDFKDLARKSAADKVLRNKAVNLKHNGYRHGLVLMISKFFD